MITLDSSGNAQFTGVLNSGGSAAGHKRVIRHRRLQGRWEWASERLPQPQQRTAQVNARYDREADAGGKIGSDGRAGLDDCPWDNVTNRSSRTAAVTQSPDSGAAGQLYLGNNSGAKVYLAGDYVTMVDSTNAGLAARQQAGMSASTAS